MHNGITINGPLNLPSRVPIHASEMFSQNIYNLITPFITEDGFNLNLEDEVIKDSLITYEGKIISDRISTLISA